MTGTFTNFVGGRWTPSQTGQTFENENPAVKGSNLGLFQSSSPDDIDEAVGAAEAAFRTWRDVAEVVPAATAVRSISEQIQLVSYLRSNAFVGVGGKRLIQW